MNYWRYLLKFKLGKQNFVVTTNYTVLPPLSETIVLVHTLQPVRTNCVALAEPLPHVSKTKFWVARHITSLHAPHTFCRVYNPKNNPIWIDGAHAFKRSLYPDQNFINFTADPPTT